MTLNSDNKRLVPVIEQMLSGAAAVPLAMYAYKQFREKGNSVSGWLAVAGVSALVLKSAGFGSLSRNFTASAEGVAEERGVKIEKTVTISKTAAELFSFWRNLENLPKIMTHLESVKTQGNRSHWIAKAPLGQTVEWDASIINEHVNELIAWESLAGSQVRSAGSVRFREIAGDHGTEVRVNLKYDPPGGVAGDKLAKLFRKNAGAEIEQDLIRFKQIMEAGESPTIEGQSSARKVKNS